MTRGFLNEIKNVAVNRATNKINAQINNALGGGVGLPTSRDTKHCRRICKT